MINFMIWTWLTKLDNDRRSIKYSTVTGFEHSYSPILP